MKLNAEYEARDGYLYVKATGEFDFAAAQTLFRELMDEALRLGVSRVLCDLTVLKGLDPSPSSLIMRFDIGEYVARLIPRDLRLALLETPLQFTEGRFGEDVMCNRGAVVKVTPHLREALEWLGVASSAAALAGDGR